MIVEFSDEAYLDIEDIVLWYESIRKGLSLDFESCLENGVNEIVQNPDACQKRYSYVRIRFIKRFPFGIHYYLSDEKTIRIIGIVHTSRSPKVWFDRL